MELGRREATKDVTSGDLSAFLRGHHELVNSDNNPTPVDNKPPLMPKRDRLWRNYAFFSEIKPSIIAPEIAADNFEINPDILGIVENNNFSGLPLEDPYLHLNFFLAICNTFKINGASDDAIRLRLFPFSLKGRARVWLHYLPGGSITTWNELTEAFLTRYFSFYQRKNQED